MSSSLRPRERWRHWESEGGRPSRRGQSRDGGAGLLTQLARPPRPAGDTPSSLRVLRPGHPHTPELGSCLGAGGALWSRTRSHRAGGTGRGSPQRGAAEEASLSAATPQTLSPRHPVPCSPATRPGTRRPRLHQRPGAFLCSAPAFTGS